MISQSLQCAAVLLGVFVSGAITPLRGQQASGQRLFLDRGHCHSCHGTNARGTKLGPDLGSRSRLHGDGSLQSLRSSIVAGVARPRKAGAPMPPMGGAALSPDEVDALTVYVWSLARPLPSRGLPDTGTGVAGLPIAGGPDFEPIIEIGGELFPSFVLATATATLQGTREVAGTDRFFGDQLGMLGVRVAAPGHNARVRLEVVPRGIGAPSAIDAVLPDSGEVYELFPRIRYDYAVLRELRQPLPVNVTFTLRVAGREPTRRTAVVRVRSVHDVPFYISDHKGVEQDVSWMFAAYVNENHPRVDSLLTDALSTGIVEGFAGYQAGADVDEQVFAIWHALQRRGLHYSSITTPSAESETVSSQHVRFLGDALDLGQANCVDGSVLFASVLRKIGVDPFLVVMPGHMMVGFYRDAQHRDFTVLETTLMGALHPDPLEGDLGGPDAPGTVSAVATRASRAAYDAAVATGQRQYNRAKSYLAVDRLYRGYARFDIASARRAGIMPIN